MYGVEWLGRPSGHDTTGRSRVEVLHPTAGSLPCARESVLDTAFLALRLQRGLSELRHQIAQPRGHWVVRHADHLDRPLHLDLLEPGELSLAHELEPDKTFKGVQVARTHFLPHELEHHLAQEETLALFINTFGQQDDGGLQRGKIFIARGCVNVADGCKTHVHQ